MRAKRVVTVPLQPYFGFHGSFSIYPVPIIRERRIGVNPEKSDLVNFRGPDEENLVNSVFCCFSWEKSTKSSQNPGLANEFSANLRGQPNWTGPIANSSEIRKAPKNYVDRHVVGWSAACHVDHPCGWQMLRWMDC